jgi:hypothetical protein
MHRLAGKAFGKYEDFTSFATAGKSIVANIKKSVNRGATLYAGFSSKLAAATQIFIHTSDKLLQETISVSLLIPCSVAMLEGESFCAFPGGETSLN